MSALVSQQRIVIGVHACDAAVHLAETLRFLQTNTSQSHQVIVLQEGDVEPGLPSELANAGIVLSATKGNLGAPSCFNRLFRECSAEVYVFLQAGSLVGPAWLERLLEALNSDRRNGLAGPSTNRCWNEQGQFRQAPGGTDAVTETAAEAWCRFGERYRNLEPLHSLADFCYAVRREVIEDVGPADEGYGQGPCWEMDYNIRAARAGWRGVWACGAYVHRLPKTKHSEEIEAQLFQASKQRYQDKFCGARLRGEKKDFRSHCRGDACPNFAPAQFRDRWNPAAKVERVEPPRETQRDDNPLVTCIMPTFNRRAFVPGAIEGFFRQNYGNLELLVVDDGSDPVKDLMPADPRIRYLQLDKRKVLGDKRNYACEQARGEIIVHWDDDDWYPADRVSRQVSRMLDERADISGSSTLYYWDVAGERAWVYRYSGRGRNWVAGNTLAYRRAFWQRCRFSSLQVGEDSRFVWADRGARISDLNDPGLCVARIHAANTSKKVTGNSCWRPLNGEDAARLIGPSLDHFRQRSSGRISAIMREEYPLVSCIMPLGNRREFVRLALECFQRQDYPKRELVIVDDGRRDLSEELKCHENVRYLRLSPPRSIGEKRNIACKSARGEIIVHWDDDDWYDSRRLNVQVGAIVGGEADLTGLKCRYVFEALTGHFWNPMPALHRRMFYGNVHGGTLAFRKSIFDQGVRYPDINLAEDARFLQAAMRKGYKLAEVPNEGTFVYVRHGANTWKFTVSPLQDSAGWTRVDCPSGFAGKLHDYQKSAGAKLAA